MQTQALTASPETAVRFWLERGRTHRSSKREPEAKPCFEQALTQARAAGLDALVVDAIHMQALLETDPQEQLRLNKQALEHALGSQQEPARRWEASLRNNIGMALHAQEKFAAALEQFKLALTLRETQGNWFNLHVAHWMVAWTLRSLERVDEAIEIQSSLERTMEERAQTDPHATDPHVFEELALLWGIKGDQDQAEHYRQKQAASKA